MFTIPLPDKRVSELTPEEMAVFRQWIGFEDGGAVIPYPTSEEADHRQRRELWKQRYAGLAPDEPRLLVQDEQILTVKTNTEQDTDAKEWFDGVLRQADTVIELPYDFFSSFIPDLGPWNPRGNYCPHCIGEKSPEGINLYFWTWDWQDPHHLTCPYCGITYPDERYPENGTLVLPRTGKSYTFHIRPDEWTHDDWRLGKYAARYVEQPAHVSFSGNIRAMKLAWALAQVKPLSLAYAFTGEGSYASAVERILLRMAEVYPGYLLHSYFQDVVDADPGYAVDHADALPTVFKRNACIPAYDGRYGRNEDTTTRVTRVATGLWGCSRLAPELSATARIFLELFQGYDLVRREIEPGIRRRIEQDFLLEFYLDVRAYEPITNKAGPVRASRVAFGLVYNDEDEVRAGIDGFHDILESQFYPDGSMKESPLYGHKPIDEDLWQIPEMLRTREDLYSEGLYRAGLTAFGAIATPLGTQPPIDDCYEDTRIERRTVDIAAARCGIIIPNPGGPPSEFAILNANLAALKSIPVQDQALTRYYKGRHLACLGYGSGPERVQMYVLGEDDLHGHRHAGALNMQLYVGGWEVFPDLGYIWDHPGNRWVKATASHQTVVIDGQNSVATAAGRLLAFSDEAPQWCVDMMIPLEGDTIVRRALTLLRRTDGWPTIIDLFDVEGGHVHDYNVRVNVPPGEFLTYGPTFSACETPLYQEHSYYPLRDCRTGATPEGGWYVTWGHGDRQVRAMVLTPCDQVFAYGSPGWRDQLEITADPDKYFDTLVLRNQQSRSRFVVVYDIVHRMLHVQSATMREEDGATVVRLEQEDGETQEIRVPHRTME